MSIQEKCMLVSLSVSMWTARKFDRSASSDTASRYGAKEDSARVNKLLMPKDAMVDVTRAQTKLRQYFLKMTLPWNDNGQRLLSSDLYMEFTAEMRKLSQEFDNAADELCQKYAILVAEAEVELNGLFNSSDYPDQGTIRERFNVEIDFSPVPDSGHLIVDLDNQHKSEIQKAIDDATQKKLAKAQGDAWQRLYEVVSRMAERLTDTDAVFRDSLVHNISSLLDLLPGLNINDDPNLMALQKEVEEKLLNYTPKELRKDTLARKDTAESAQEIMDKMAAFM